MRAVRAGMVGALLSMGTFFLAHYAAGLGVLMSLVVQAVVTGVLVAAEERR